MFIDYDGKLAHTVGWFTEQAKPQRTRHIRVSDIYTADCEWLLDIPDQQVEWTGDYGVIYRPGYRPTTIDVSDWKSVTESEPVKKPRRGKRQGQVYDWKWQWGRWEREWID